MKTKEEILTEVSLEGECIRRGMTFRREGKELVACCPLHEDTKPSFAIYEGGLKWFCHPCGRGGNVIDLVMALDGLSFIEACRKLTGDPTPRAGASPRAFEPKTEQVEPPTGKSIVATYDYTDESGNLIFQVVRFEPKDFRQRKLKKGGGWDWNLKDVVRVLYNLPKLAEASFVWIVEGEKDADALNAVGMVATTNAGGAKKWEPQYSESLRGKDIIICGDNDVAGQEHVKLVTEALKDVARSIRVIRPPLPHKDVSDFLATFERASQGISILVDIATNAEVTHRGRSVPVLTMFDLERRYAKFATQASFVSLNLAHWLPALTFKIRPLVPGELVTILADTGVGKTMVLQNIALTCQLPTLLFEMELPDTLTFERFAGMATKQTGGQVFNTYRDKNVVDWKSDRKLDEISVCVESRLTPPDIERIIEGAAIKTDKRPVVVMLDYVQLIRGAGKSRYENLSTVAEELKVIAKETNTIIIIASQVRRSDDREEVGLHDAKDSGSIENSSGLVLGIWRDKNDKNRMLVKVCKNTKGTAGAIIPCRIHESLQIFEETQPPAALTEHPNARRRNAA